VGLGVAAMCAAVAPSTAAQGAGNPRASHVRVTRNTHSNRRRLNLHEEGLSVGGGGFTVRTLGSRPRGPE
jgi:hypothetical protein